MSRDDAILVAKFKDCIKVVHVFNVEDADPENCAWVDRYIDMRLRNPNHYTLPIHYTDVAQELAKELNSSYGNTEYGIVEYEYPFPIGYYL